jgi:hypothetical protein
MVSAPSRLSVMVLGSQGGHVFGYVRVKLVNEA